MVYQALYRKYRPNSFKLVFGQDVITTTLKNIIKNNKLSHAYLFTGPRGTGKTSCAKLFAKAINCYENKSGDACNNCESCNSYNNNSNPDIIEIDAASNNGVDEIREIRNKVNLVPSISKYKVYIIDEVHMLSIGAFNALLKTLEEPPKHIIFILATTEPQKLPVTVISRCQRFDFKKISDSAMINCLKNIASKEEIEISDKALKEIIFNSKGGMRDAIGMLDQASVFSNNKIEQNDIELLSGNISDEEVIEYINLIINNDITSLLQKNNKYEEAGKDLTLIVEKIINILRNELIKLKVEQNSIFSFNDSKMIDLIEIFNEIANKMINSNYKKTILDVELIKILNLNSNVSRETLNNKKEITSKDNKKISNVSRETLIDDEIIKLKKIRINNILLSATKNDINYVSDMWPNINNFLIDDTYKICAGILLNSTIVAASNKGIIITLTSDIEVKRIEKMYDLAKKMIEKILNSKYKVVFINENYWKENRPIYAQQAKNKELSYIDEENLINEIKKNNNSTKEFDEFVEMEE